MRIAILASGFPDYSVELGGALARAGPVLLLADRDALARERAGAAVPPGVQLRTWRQSNVLRRWSGAASLAARLRLWRPDVVLAHEHPHPHLTALLRSVAGGARLGLIVHDPEPHPGRDAAFAQRRAEGIAAQRALADHLFAHWTGGAERLHALTGRAATALPHGPILRPATPAGPPPGLRRLLLFGRMEAYKGLETLLLALRRPELAGLEPGLEVRGAGPELERLAPLLAATPRCAVHPGPASRAELLTALGGCDLVVAPYLHASASGVVAAAMANARGVVASAVGGLPQMVRPGVNGLLAPPGDDAALAGALAAALPQATRLGDGAQALGEAAFSWDEAAEIVLRELARPAGVRRP